MASAQVALTELDPRHPVLVDLEKPTTGNDDATYAPVSGWHS